MAKEKHITKHKEHENLKCESCEVKLCTEPDCELCAHDNGKGIFCTKCLTKQE